MKEEGKKGEKGLTFQTRLIFKQELKKIYKQVKYNTTTINSNKPTGTVKSLKMLRK